jgi:hypothetical protein
MKQISFKYFNMERINLLLWSLVHYSDISTMFYFSTRISSIDKSIRHTPVSLKEKTTEFPTFVSDLNVLLKMDALKNSQLTCMINGVISLFHWQLHIYLYQHPTIIWIWVLYLSTISICKGMIYLRSVFESGYSIDTQNDDRGISTIWFHDGVLQVLWPLQSSNS